MPVCQESAETFSVSADFFHYSENRLRESEKHIHHLVAGRLFHLAVMGTGACLIHVIVKQLFNRDISHAPVGQIGHDIVFSGRTLLQHFADPEDIYHADEQALKETADRYIYSFKELYTK